MKKIMFLSMVLALGVGSYANQSIVINDNSNTKPYKNIENSAEENYICNADCLFGSCSVSCPAPETGGGGGAACGCYSGFPACACGEGHGGGIDENTVLDVSVSNDHMNNFNQLSSISSTFVSTYGVRFHTLIEASIKRGIYNKSDNKADIQRFVDLKKYSAQLSIDEKQKLDSFVRKFSK